MKDTEQVEIIDKWALIVTSCTDIWGILMPLLYDSTDNPNLNQTLTHIWLSKKKEKVFTSHKLDFGIKKYWWKNICVKEQRNNRPLNFPTVGQLKVFL